MTKAAENCPLSCIDQYSRIPADLAVKVRLQQRVFRAEDVVTMRSQARESGGKPNRGAPIFRCHHVAQAEQFRLHGAGGKEAAWKLKEIDG